MQRKPTILAVDDTPSNLVALEAVLDRDFVVRTARSGHDAIAILAAHSDVDVDVIVMDLQMPGMDGYEAAAAIKKLPHCADIPIVFLTAVYSEDPHVKRGYEVGGVDYFTKPFDPDLLRLKIGIYASFRRQVRERDRQLRATQELLRAERRLIESLKTLPTGVIVVDADGHLLKANADVYRILTMSHHADRRRLAAVLGWWDATGKAIDPRAALLAAALQGESRTEELTFAIDGGSTKSLHACASPLTEHDREIAGAVVVMHDVSEPVRAKDELEALIAKLVPVQ